VLALGRAVSEWRDLKYGPDQSYEEIRDAFVEAYNSLNRPVHDYRPFYTPGVYTVTKELLSKAKKVYDYQQDERIAKKREEDKEKLLDEINEMIDPICEAIRRRIWIEMTPGPQC